MKAHRVVSRAEWLSARKDLLALEKEFTQERDRLTRARRDLPWVLVDKEYRFEGPDGVQTLSELFDGRSQLIVYHFMFGPDWDEGCPMCSFWADNFDRNVVHLHHRDISLVAVSRAPLKKLQAYRKRMGWSFPWFSSLETDFNQDYHVSFTPEEVARGDAYYNYAARGFPVEEAHGVSVFAKDDDGQLYHTYSCYARGIEMLNVAYRYMDLVPKGRDEEGLRYPMEWVRRHDRYED